MTCMISIVIRVCTCKTSHRFLSFSVTLTNHKSKVCPRTDTVQDRKVIQGERLASTGVICRKLCG